MQKSDRIKAEVSLRAIADAAGTVWDLKKSRPAKGDWWGSCPLHGEATASFHVVEPAGTGGVFKCFGCHKGGSVIDFTMEHLGLDFVEAVRRLADDAGISGEISEERQRDLERQRQNAKGQGGTGGAAPGRNRPPDRLADLAAGLHSQTPLHGQR